MVQQITDVRGRRTVGTPKPAPLLVTESEDADASALLAQKAESGPEGIDYGESSLVAGARPEGLEPPTF